MTTRLTLICHGPTAATRAARFPRGEPLDDACALPAAALTAAARASRRHVAPAPAARATADRLGAGFRVDEALRDLDVGRWSGLAVAAVAAAEPAALAAWTQDPAAAPHGGESVAALVERVAGWMDGRARAGGRVFAVTHAAPLRAAVLAAMGAGPACFWRVEAAPLVTAALSHDGRRWTLVSLTPP